MKMTDDVQQFINSLEDTSYSPDKAALLMWNFLQDKMNAEKKEQEKEQENRRRYEIQKQQYNGWVGDGTPAGAYATWAVAMWFDGPSNDDGLSELMQSYGPEVTSKMAEAVEEYIMGYITESEFNNHWHNMGGCIKDLVGYMFSGINWRELCENWIEEIEFESCRICGETTCPGVDDVSDCPDYEECGNLS